MFDPEPSARSIRAALYLGFGLVVGTWLFAALFFTRRIADVEQQAAAINSRYMQAQELLSTVRMQVLVASVYVRDALLEPDAYKSGDYARRLNESYAAIDEALSQYVPVVDSEAERDEVGLLRSEITDFRRTMLDVLTTNADTRSLHARALLRTRVVPKRERVIGLSEHAQALNRGAFVQQQSAMAGVYRATQRQIWTILGAALAASLCIALFATLYAGRLEDRLRRQRAKDVRNTRDLQQLSSKLLTAQEEERRAIARELHDEVGQAVTAIKVELALAQHAIDGTGAGHVLEDARSIADGILHVVRDMSHGLHPALLDDLGLVAATEWYLKGFSRRHAVRVDTLHDRIDERFAPTTESAIFRIIQEALTNVAKHAGATHCRVYLQRLPTTLVVTVEDDGAGFDPTQTRGDTGTRGLGLVSIRERTAELRGTVRLESTPGKGTRLTLEVPVQTRVSPIEDWSAAAGAEAIPEGETLGG